MSLPHGIYYPSRGVFDLSCVYMWASCMVFIWPHVEGQNKVLWGEGKVTREAVLFGRTD